ncbi:hypothetical protein [Sodalis sp. RH18]|uniref:hypothetical protein n=1 Tax=Sodalis sp. RH18 TaxID=3394333 RepID=UPI0039B636B1
MKQIITLRLGAELVTVSSCELVLDLSACGRGFVTVVHDAVATGQAVRIDVGYNNTAYRFFTGYVERDQPAENGSRRLFVREVAGVFESLWPVSMQHPTLRQITDKLAADTGVTFVLPAGQDYTDTPIPHFVHHGTGWQLLATLGRAFNITDYIWQQLPDGTVWVGAWKDSRFAGQPITVPANFATAAHGGNTMTIPAAPAIRPGVVLNGERITRVALKDDQMSLTWTPLKSDGTPKQKTPLQRQLEEIHPELASNLHLPKLARIVGPAEAAGLGDIADPFRPRHAVNVQLLDQNGADNKNTPVYAAVPLPVPQAGDEGGFMSYPEEGTLIQLAFPDGRQDKPFINQILPEGKSLPEIKPGERLWQHRAGVAQRATQDGSWQRETDQEIKDTSHRRTVAADEETRTITTRTTTIQATDTTTVIGTAKLLAGAIMQVATGDYAVATSTNLTTKAGGNSTENIGGNKVADVGGMLTERIAGARESVSATLALIAGTVKVGNADTNVLTLLIETLDLLHELAQQTATHTHPDTGNPTNSADLAATGTAATALKAKYQPIIQ